VPTVSTSDTSSNGRKGAAGRARDIRDRPLFRIAFLVLVMLTLLALYGNDSPIGVNISYTATAVVLALLFVTLPFVVRSVQPVLLELDREMEQAAASLGARPATTFRRIVLPNLMPAILSGAALSFGKAVGDFGSVGATRGPS